MLAMPAIGLACGRLDGSVVVALAQCYVLGLMAGCCVLGLMAGCCALRLWDLS